MKLNREYSIKEIADLYHCSLSSNIDYKFNSISSINKIENHSLIYISDKRHLAKLDSNIDCAILIAKDISLNIKMLVLYVIIPCLFSLDSCLIILITIKLSFLHRLLVN